MDPSEHEEKIRARNWQECEAMIAKIQTMEVDELRAFAEEMAKNLYTVREHLADWKFIFRFKGN